MTLIEKLSNLGGIVDRDEMAKACSEIPDEDLRLALMTLALTYDQNIKIKKILIYSVSSRTTSSKSVISLRPLTCHIPVIPGLMAILAL